MRLLPFIIGVIILAGAYFVLNQNLFKKSNQPTAISSTSAELKTFQSKNLKFNIELPKNFEVEENSGRVMISSPKGNLFIDRNSTNFKSLKEYLKDLDDRNKTQVSVNEEKTINNYNSVTRIVKYNSGDTQRAVIVFVEGWIYNFYTDHEALYSDLDQIAQSFRYTP